MTHRAILGVLAAMLLCSAEPVQAADSVALSRPVMRDFVGLNTHTVQFKTDLYKPVCRLLRNYHPAEWDLGKETAVPPPFPEAKNKVDWSSLYGSWAKAGFETHATIMLASINPDGWRNRDRDIETYARGLAQCFGPSGVWPLLASVEADNEPHSYTPEQYREMFQAMARGLRAGDPKLKIATCAVRVKKPDKYNKPVECVKGLEALYDILNIHTYAFLETWPAWRRTFPENAGTTFLSDVSDMIGWRNANAPGKEIWVTEFGFDASTQPNPTEGPAKGFIQATDEEQARWIVRSFLVFASMDVGRAYLYWFNDEDKASLHAASGITRRYQPKASYHAMSQLYGVLGEYRFGRAIVQEAGRCYAFEFTHGTDAARRIIVVWSPTGSKRLARVSLPVGGKVERAVGMQTTAAEAAGAAFEQTEASSVSLEISESPVYVYLAK